MTTYSVPTLKRKAEMNEFDYVGFGYWLVNSPKGLETAHKDFLENYEGITVENPMITNCRDPESYPICVSFSVIFDEGFQYSSTFASFVSVKEMKENLLKSIKFLT